MKQKLSVLLLGIGGYGNLYVDAMLDAGADQGLTLAGVVDPRPEGCRRLEALKARGVPFYPSAEAFYRDAEADIAVISSPIQFHKDQTLTALRGGSHVLCEKPAAATPEEALKMQKAAQAAGRHLAIGYQWSCSRAIQDLKRDILKDRFGLPLGLKSIVLWPRDAAYYHRAGWAGRMQDAEGRPIRDSVANNATAHYLHNMFFLLGSEMNNSAYPETVTAELYRANPIESFDTCAVEIRIREKLFIHYYASHAIDQSYGPIFHYAFERGSAEYNEETGGRIIARFQDGSSQDYGNPYEGPEDKLWNLAHAIRGNAAVSCPIEAALPHALCIDGMHRSVPEIASFDPAAIETDQARGLTFVPGLGAALKAAYKFSCLPAALDAPFAKTGRRIRIIGGEWVNSGHTLEF